MLWQDVKRRLGRRADTTAARAAPAAPGPKDGRWQAAGALVLAADGGELAVLEALTAGITENPAPTIVYHSDIRLTARFGYHPVETVWLLEQAGYEVLLLTDKGPVARPDDWFAPSPADAAGPWLLATPPGWVAPEASP